MRTSAPELPILAPAAQLGALDRAGLAEALRPLWEDAGPLVDALVGRPVDSWRDHISVARLAIGTMDELTRAALLAAHPRIGTDPVALARSSGLSHLEQGGSNAAIRARLSALNDLYEDRFGFPFVEWVAGRPIEAIVEVIEARLTRDRADELETGCAALVAIAQDRLSRLEASEK